MTQRHWITAALFAALLGLSPIMAEAKPAPFFEAVSDMPLMPGFKEQSALTTIFDKPHGRIVKVEAVGAPSVKSAQQFYLQTLPNLGWNYKGNKRFVRDGEEIILDFARVDTQTKIYITLTPKQRTVEE